jgi:sulfite exporter TauE/SafE
VTDDLSLLALTAATVGFIHTLVGPDHYLPFIVLSRARGWTMRRTAWVTLLCGLGHVLSSVVLGAIGIALGLAVSHLEGVEAVRGQVAAWLLIAVGLVYGAWGLHRALRSTGHRHYHFPTGHALHELSHHHGELPAQDAQGREIRLTPWVLFIVFVLGPCEPLIPVLMYPAATASAAGVLLVVGVFAVVTMGTMLAVVWLGTLGVSLLPMGRLERYSHALAGGAIFLSGLGIELLGL